MLSYIYYTAAGVILLILLVVFLIVFYHLKNRKNERMINSRREKWEQILFQYLADEISLEKAAAGMNSDYIYLYQFLKPYIKNLKGDDFEQLKELTAANGMNDYFLNRLQTADRSGKIRAAVFLGKMEVEAAVEQLRENLNSEDKNLQTVSIQALADIGEQQLFFEVLKVMLKKSTFTFEALTEISIRFGEDICPKIKEFLEKEKWDKRIEAVFEVPEFQILSLFFDIFGYYRYLPGLESMLQYLDPQNNEEVLIHIFKALVKMEYPIEQDLTEFLTSENWVIRSQAARYLAVTGDPKYLDQLYELITDSNWWVSYYSALAVFKIGRGEILKEIVENDRAGKEMSRYVLAQNNI
ncbi:HEAT repeat domain-containing protein [Halanaerobium saccharolyticum]|uniref:HEAT repeat domain-containing protein n=1 Tax=Halanaerobium saccharolyticum TaxID=43595 RepID=UPI003FCE034F